MCGISFDIYINYSRKNSGNNKVTQTHEVMLTNSLLLDKDLCQNTRRGILQLKTLNPNKKKYEGDCQICI